ncbi:hypothetical protein [Salinisphaera sp. Q1T1-3]|uniref:hypothetical protein n=1 Tax=Salinisphaera sp. Q1T1-3 TaxID=2321229 RepID=UPI000E72B2D1|nr:hypothetical protein [Salinisphaera sp. Q1T1-3]RJS93692.1 hypothetical protein D3260_06370 [Salinisphaera sp. Q1T1-3]
MLGRRPAWLGGLCAAMDHRLIGPGLYALNLNDWMIRRMVAGHVYSDAGWLTPSRMADKRQGGAAGARHTSVRFATGALDPFEDRADFHDAAAGLSRERRQLIRGGDTPCKSQAEMQPLDIAPVVLSQGKLGVPEEFAASVAATILDSAKAQAA